MLSNNTGATARFLFIWYKKSKMVWSSQDGIFKLCPRTL